MYKKCDSDSERKNCYLIPLLVGVEPPTSSITRNYYLPLSLRNLFLGQSNRKWHYALQMQTGSLKNRVRSLENCNLHNSVKRFYFLVFNTIFMILLPSKFLFDIASPFSCTGKDAVLC